MKVKQFLNFSWEYIVSTKCDFYEYIPGVVRLFMMRSNLLHLNLTIISERKKSISESQRVMSWARNRVIDNSAAGARLFGSICKTNIQGRNWTHV